MYRRALAAIVTLLVLVVAAESKTLADSADGQAHEITEDLMPAGLDQQGYM